MATSGVSPTYTHPGAAETDDITLQTVVRSPGNSLLRPPSAHALFVASKRCYRVCLRYRKTWPSHPETIGLKMPFVLPGAARLAGTRGSAWHEHWEQTELRNALQYNFVHNFGRLVGGQQLDLSKSFRCATRYSYYFSTSVGTRYNHL
jgi:hypothetical protein